jgi:hypothetical protein
MWQLLTSETEVLIRAGFMYQPLLFDAQVEEEIKNLTGAAATGVVDNCSELLFEVEGQYFIKSLSLNSLVENYPAAFPEEYDRQSSRLRQRIFPEARGYRLLLDNRLKTILFEILPHFWRWRRGRRREKNGAAAVLAYLAAKLPENTHASGDVKELWEQQAHLRQAIRRLESLGRGKPEPPPEFRGPVRKLAGWFQEVLECRLVRQEIKQWQRELDQVQELLKLPERELAVLLSAAARGAVELEGCGCCPDSQHAGEYWIYLRSGDYVLQDYFGRPYLFPDCRVAISTAGPWHPIVLERYKHPLLRRFEKGQQICLTDYQPDGEFSGPGVIRALEAGLNALFYGYNSRKRNGYNSLDGFGRHLSVVDFEDWRLSQDDLRVLRGELEVKNRNI